ncbi:MAG: hypothetical protein GY694_17715 [Gammaproteobacteria bacterium]|nr:hypothetical protein [Gammaproteobacteria bacterium]
MRLILISSLSLALLSVAGAQLANAGKLTDCDEAADYAQKIAVSRDNGSTMDSWLHKYDDRFAISNDIVRYVFMMKSVEPKRINMYVYKKCKNGTYGSKLQ